MVVSCSLTPTQPLYPVTPNVAVESTFKISIYSAETLLGSGTAWIVGFDKGNSLLITAGHVCSAEAPKLNYKISDRFDQEAVVEEITHSSEPDLCLLKAHGYVGRPLLIAQEDPEYADEVGYVGAPHARYGGGMAPVYFGRYMGADWAGVEAAPGVSGSAIWTHKGVFGVLVALDPRFHHLAKFVTRKELVTFLAHATH